MGKYYIIPSLSMILAKPRTLRINNAPVRSKELIVVDVARLEDHALQMFPHPVSFLGEEYKEFKAAVDRGESVVKNKKLRKLYLQIDHTVKRWPPKYGTIEFFHYLSSLEGMRDVFWLSVGRHNKMKRIESDRLSKELSLKQWNTVGRIAWGHSVEIKTENKGQEKDDELSTGLDWAYHFYELETKRGWTRDYILQMPFSQFLSSLSKPREVMLEISDDNIPEPKPFTRFY